MPTVWMPPVSPKDPVKPAGWSGPGSCQIVAFTLGPVGCVILRAPFRRDVSISPSLGGAPAVKPCWPSKPDPVGALPVLDPRDAGAGMGLRALAPPAGEPLT